MSIQRMNARVADSVVLGSGYVRQRRIAFHKRSNDGSAKANAVETNCQADRVWGVVYRLRQADQITLDRYESLGVGYDRGLFDVVAGDRILKAWMYVARPEAIDDSLKPYSWYHDFVISGAREHRLPMPYVDHLSQFDTIIDPDQHRHSQNQSLIGDRPQF